MTTVWASSYVYAYILLFDLNYTDHPSQSIFKIFSYPNKQYERTTQHEYMYIVSNVHNKYIEMMIVVQ